MKVIKLLINSTFLLCYYGLAPLRITKNSLLGSYIISLKEEARIPMKLHLERVQNLIKERAGPSAIKKVYKNIGKMYHAILSPDILTIVREFDEIDLIETDGIAWSNYIQTNATWGLARISQRQFINKSIYQYSGDGKGVTVYILDSGILINHPEFEGRATWGANFVKGSPNTDERGHGTHCAGIVGSKTYGVSKAVNLVAVKVLSSTGGGNWSTIIEGIDWILANPQGRIGNVINMSLGGYYTASMNKAVEIANEKGFLVVVSAGNSNDNACSYSPASSNSVITVAASNIDDEKAWFSNYGKCIDIIGPGVDILSTWNNGTVHITSGTSMASPHIAGLAAYYWSNGNITMSQVKEKLILTSTKDIIKGFGNDTSNYLVYNNII